MDHLFHCHCGTFRECRWKHEPSLACELLLHPTSHRFGQTRGRLGTNGDQFQSLPYSSAKFIKRHVLQFYCQLSEQSKYHEARTMKILVFLHGTTIMHRSASGRSW